MINKQTLVILTFARSGSNFLCDLLGQIPEIDSYREIFQHRGVHTYTKPIDKEYSKYITRSLSEEFGIKDNIDVRNPELVEAVHKDPLKLIKMLKQISRKPIISFKIFVEHLTNEQLAEILNVENTKVICLSRTPIEQFISAEKAKALGVFIDKDTSTYKPEISVDSFKKQLNKRQRWIECINECNVSAHLTYEDTTSLPTNGDRVAALSNLLNSIGLNIEKVTDVGAISEYNQNVISEKQDKSQSNAEKVINYDEFLKACEKQGVSILEDLTLITHPKIELKSYLY